MATIHSLTSSHGLKKPRFFEQNWFWQICLVAVTLAIGGSVWHQHIQGQKETQAQRDLWPLIYLMQEREYAKALEGTSVQEGLLVLLKNYTGTAAAEQAKVYAVRAYMGLKEYEKALELLPAIKLKTVCFTPIHILVLQGDCYMELKQEEKAKECYLKATQENPFSYFTILPLEKLARLATAEKNYKDALSYYQQICRKFPKATSTVAHAKKQIAYLTAKEAYR